MKLCNRCNGSGSILPKSQFGYDQRDIVYIKEKCPKCKGTGQVGGKDAQAWPFVTYCNRCMGSLGGMVALLALVLFHIVVLGALVIVAVLTPIIYWYSKITEKYFPQNKQYMVTAWNRQALPIKRPERSWRPFSNLSAQ